MKNKIKKLLVLILSLITATCFIVGCDEEDIDGGENVPGENFSPSSYVSLVSSEGGTVNYQEETLVGNSKLVKGIVLEGGEGATFNLGDVNIAKSNWEGTVNTITGKPTSFIDYFYAPTISTSELISLKITLTDVANYDNVVEIIVNNSGTSEKKDGKTVINFSDSLYMVAKATRQDKWVSYLNAESTATQSVNGINNYGASLSLKSGYYGNSATTLGYDEGASVSPKGSQTAPVSLVYDKEENCLYSPVTDSLETDKSSSKTSFAIRNFNNVYGDRTDNSDSKWLGFKSNLVNVSVKFLDLNEVTKTKLIVTGIGGYDISKDSVFVADTDYVSVLPAQPTSALANNPVTLNAPLSFTLINSKLNEGSKVTISKGTFSETVTFTEKTYAYTFSSLGEYNLDFYYGNGDKAGTYKIIVSTAVLDTATLGVETTGNGSIATYGTYKQLKNTTKFTGIRLTGKTGATFNLGTLDIGNSDWAGSYSSTGKPTATDKNESLLEMVFDPHDDKDFVSNNGGGTGELQDVTLTFTQGEESMSVRMYYYSYGGDKNGYELRLTAKAGSQEQFGSYRSNLEKLTGGIRKGRIVVDDFKNLGLDGNVDKFSGSWGTSTVALPIYYDFNDVALYTPSQYQGKADGLNDSYLIRDFDSTEAKYNSLSAEKVVTWSGFKKDNNGKCFVNVTATFGTVRGDSPSSVVITKLGNNDLSSGSIDLEDSLYQTDKISEITSANVGEAVTLTPAYKKWHPLNAIKYDNCIVEIYKQGETDKLDTITFNGTAQTYTFNVAGEYVLKYYDSSGGKQIGNALNVTVT